MNDAPPARRIVLVRHGRVADKYQGICYGSSDVELSDEGQRQTEELALKISTWPVTELYHSGLTRTRVLAERIAQRTGLVPIAAPGLQEFHFGDWELQSWEEIYTVAPDGFERMLREPNTYAPPGGETIDTVQNRVMAWYHALPATGLIVAAAHCGSIGALRGSLAGLAPVDWIPLIPLHGTIVELEPG